MTSKRFIKLKFDAYHYVGEGETEPIAKKLGFRNKAVFECIASHQDQNCISDITIDQIVELTGIGRSTVINAVKELESFVYEGKPIIEKLQYYKGEKKKNIYKILPNPLVSYYGERMEEEVINSPEFELLNNSNSPEFGLLNDSNSPKFELTKEINTKEINNKEIQKEDIELSRELKNKDIIHVFCEAYQKQTMNDYKRNYKMDNKFTTMFLKQTEDLKNNETKRLVELIVENYESWSTNTSKYPLTIRTLTTDWVQLKARDLLKKEKESMSQMEQQSVEATKRNDIALSSIMSRIKRKGGQ